MKFLPTRLRDDPILFIGLIPEIVQAFENTFLNIREVKLGPDYIRWEKKRGFIFHNGVSEVV